MFQIVRGGSKATASFFMISTIPCALYKMLLNMQNNCKTIVKVCYSIVKLHKICPKKLTNMLYLPIYLELVRIYNTPVQIKNYKSD